MLVAAGVLIGLVVGGVVGVVVVRSVGASRFDKALRTRQELLKDAEREADAMRREARIEAREDAVRLRAEIEAEVQERRSQITRTEERLQSKEEEVEGKIVELSRREQGLADREEASKQLHAELKEAKQRELENSKDLIRHELARQARQMEEESRTEAKRRARNLVADALQRVAASHAAETTVTVIELPSDDMKGRIIGREGRNIRALEHLT